MSMTNQAPELLPCPFCGNAAKIRCHDDDEATIMCANNACRLVVGVPATKRAIAIKNWNTRLTPAERPVPQVREALEQIERESDPERPGAYISAGERLATIRRIVCALLSARPSDAAVADVRWAVNVLLEKIAKKFEGLDTWDIWRSDAATLVRSFKHDAQSLALPPDEPAPKIDDSVEKACAAYLADAPLDGRHSDAAGGNAYEIIAWAQEELAHFRSQLEPARITPIAELPPMEALPLSVGFAVEYLDGVMTEEQAEIQRMWKLVRTHIMSVSVTPSTVGGEAQ